MRIPILFSGATGKRLFWAALLLVSVMGGSPARAQLQWSDIPRLSVLGLGNVIFHDGYFYATMPGGYAKSADGRQWVTVALSKSAGLSGLMPVKGGILALGSKEQYWTPDGVPHRIDVKFNHIAGWALLNGIGVFAGLQKLNSSDPLPRLARWRDADGTLTVDGAELPGGAPSSEWVTATDREFLLAAQGQIYASGDGVVWSHRGIAPFQGGRPFYWKGVLFAGRHVSKDMGATWTYREEGYSITPQAAGNGYLVAPGYLAEPGHIFTSTDDGERWLKRRAYRLSPSVFTRIAYGNGVFVATTPGEFLISDTAGTSAWITAPQFSFDAPGRRILWKSKQGLSYQLQTSTDLITWKNPQGPYAGSGGEETLPLDSYNYDGVLTECRYFRIVAE